MFPGGFYGSQANGLLDEVRIWNVARTEAQIAANKNGELSGPQTGLVGYWPMNEGTGLMLHDVSGAGRDVDLTSAGYTSASWTNGRYSVASIIGNYRYAFNGKELDTDIEQDDYDFGARIYDARLGRFMSVDPLATKYPDLSTYLFANNNPIALIDADGAAGTEPSLLQRALAALKKLGGDLSVVNHGAANAVLSANTFGTSDILPGWLGGTDNADDYSGADKTRYLLGRVAGNLLALGQAGDEAAIGGALGLSGGGSVIGAVTLIHSGGVALAATFDLAQTLAALAKNGIVLSEGQGGTSEQPSTKQENAAHGKTNQNNIKQNNGRINVNKPKLGPGRHDRLWDGKPNPLYTQRKGGTEPPSNSKELFANAVPDETGKNWYAIDKNGNYHRFAPTETGGKVETVHWNGSTESDRSIIVPKYAKDRLTKTN